MLAPDFVLVSHVKLLSTYQVKGVLEYRFSLVTERIFSARYPSLLVGLRPVR